MPDYVQACAEPDFDIQTGTCANPYWSTNSGGFPPPLPVADAMELTTALLLLCSIAFGFKFLRRFISR